MILPIRLNTSYDCGVSGFPNSSISPIVGFQRFMISFMTVVLPAPLGPKNP